MKVNNTIDIKDIIAPHFYKTFNSKKPHQIYAGGRASTKTSMLSIKISEFNLEYKNCNAIIIKRYQNTIRNSVYKEIKRALKRLGLNEGVDYKDDIDTFLYIKLMKLDANYFISSDDANYISRADNISIYTIFNSEYTAKMINKIARGENIDADANNLYDRMVNAYESAINYGIDDVENNSTPYIEINVNFKKAYQSLIGAFALVYFVSYTIAYVLLMIIMRLIAKEWTTIGQKVMGLAMADLDELTPSAWQIIVYNLSNYLLFSTSALLSSYLVGMFGIFSFEIFPGFNLLWIMLFLLTFNLLSLFMPLFNKRRFNVSTFLSRLQSKDKNEFDTLPEENIEVVENGTGTKEQ